MLPGVRAPLRSGGRRLGGALGYPAERLSEEVAYLAYYFHWPYAQIMNMDHRERRHWAREVARINERINAGAAGEPVEE